jgi:hypothetical protein
MNETTMLWICPHIPAARQDKLVNPLNRIQTHRTSDGEARDTLTNHRMSYPDASHPSTSPPAHSALRRGPRGPRRTPRVPAPPRPALAGVPSRVHATSRLLRGKPMTLPSSPPKWPTYNQQPITTNVLFVPLLEPNHNPVWKILGKMGTSTTFIQPSWSTLKSKFLQRIEN